MNDDDMLTWLTEDEQNIVHRASPFGAPEIMHFARALAEARRALDIAEDYDTMCCSVCDGPIEDGTSLARQSTYEHEPLEDGTMCPLATMPRGRRLR